MPNLELPTRDTSKPLVQSKTAWVAIAAPVITWGLQAAGYGVPDEAILVTIITGVINLIVRMRTEKPIRSFFRARRANR